MRFRRKKESAKRRKIGRMTVMKRMAWLFIAAVCLAAHAGEETPPAETPVLTPAEKIEFLRAGARAELFGNILPFWLKHSFEDRNDGFVGGLSNDLTVDRYAPKGLSLHGRLLWFFPAVHRMQPDPDCLKAAERAVEYIEEYFLDEDEGGYYWRLQPGGAPEDRRKVLYGHAFMIYGYSEYYRAVKKEWVLDRTKELFELVEEKFRDQQNGGYRETLTREWDPAPQALLAGSETGSRTLNTHLHLLEAYANLYRAWPDPQVRAALEALVRLFLDKMYNAQEAYFFQSFDDDWKPLSNTLSFGHDLETVWLLCDAADTLGDEALIKEVQTVGLKVTDAVLRHGVDADGGLFTGSRDGWVTSTEKIWWPQAEALSGFLTAWKISGDERYLDAAVNCWRFIQTNLVDSKNGEWFYSTAITRKKPKADKISEWKGPYHNGRACMEIIRRLE